MPATVEMLGQRFGRWTVLAYENQKHRKGATWLCRCDCGNERVVLGYQLRSGGSRSCGCLRDERSIQRNKTRVGPQHPNWVGGRTTTGQRNPADRYVRVMCPGHPRAKQNYVLEHILVMEKTLGRYLLPNETVHHKNGQRSDNRESNLELWSSVHPGGQRVADKVEYAVEILRLYAPDRLK